MDEVTTQSRSTAPVEAPNPSIDGPADEEMPRVVMTRRTVIAFVLFVAIAVGFLYFVLPKLAGLNDTWDEIKDGNPAWIVAALCFELLSFGGYVLLFRAVFTRGESRIGWRASYEITMAGVAATRLFATAGAGGVALTAWALRRSGMPREVVACRMIAFLVLLYSVFMSSLLICGVGLYTGIFAGGGSFSITMIPAIFAAIAMAVFAAMALVPGDLSRIAHRSFSSPRVARWAKRLAVVPESIARGVRTAIDILRSGDLGILGAVGWWGFDIACLWACFHAFGEPPPWAVMIAGYFIGQLANTLPVPGGIGAVDGGMIGAFAAFGVDFDLAVVSVLVYRGFAFWLPTIPGAIAYLQLRGRVRRWQAEAEPEPANA
jgi:putative heme transporter